MKIVKIEGLLKNNSFGCINIETLDKEAIVHVICVHLHGWMDDCSVSAKWNSEWDVLLVDAVNIVEGGTSRHTNKKGTWLNSIYYIYYPKWIIKDSKTIFGKKEIPVLIQGYFMLIPGKNIKISGSEMRELLKDEETQKNEWKRKRWEITRI